MIPLGWSGGSHDNRTEVDERFLKVVIIGADSGTVTENEKTSC